MNGQECWITFIRLVHITIQNLHNNHNNNMEINNNIILCTCNFLILSKTILIVGMCFMRKIYVFSSEIWNRLTHLCFIVDKTQIKKKKK